MKIPKQYVKPLIYATIFNVLFVFVLVNAVFFIINKDIDHDMKSGFSLVKIVQAAEVYPEFVCPCCGKPLDPNNICCGAMEQRIKELDELAVSAESKQDLLLEAVRKFGLDSLVNEQRKQEIQQLLIEQAPADAPHLVFEQSDYDFGSISQKDGIVSAVFDFTNSGESDLLINNLSTSCGCTSASIIYQGQESPVFTMPGHGHDNPQGWTLSLPAGAKAQLKVYYDPMAHGLQEDPIMFITRTASIMSNDPVNFESKVKIELEQLP